MNLKYNYTLLQSCWMWFHFIPKHTRVKVDFDVQVVYLTQHCKRLLLLQALFIPCISGSNRDRLLNYKEVYSKVGK